MKVLLVNKFLYPKGGDAISTLQTGRLLKERGHEVVFWGMKHPLNPDYKCFQYFVDNIDYKKKISLGEKIKMGLKVLYSFEAKNKIERLINVEKPDLVHLNNFAHQISPSILDAFKKYNIPVVMTIHDYKLICPAYKIVINNRICTKCQNGKYYWCFINKCTQNSYGRSLLSVVEMYLHHQILHIYDKIDIFISPSQFLKEKLREMGFKKEIVYLPNSIETKNYISEYNIKDKTICYFGRLSTEKGLFTLLSAVKGLNVNLKIIGEGPLKDILISSTKNLGFNNVCFLGYKSGEELREEIRKSMVVVLPSICYENNPLTILEAFALGKPVLGSRIGGIPELVKEGETGYTFEPGNIEDLREKILTLLEDPGKIIKMGIKAREFIEENFSTEKHYQKLMEIYQMAKDNR